MNLTARHTASGHRPHGSFHGPRQIAGTDLRYHAEDVDDGSISLILGARDQRSLDRLERSLNEGDSAHLTARLPRVRGLVVDVPLDQAANFVQTLPKTTSVAVNSTIDYHRLSQFPRSLVSAGPTTGATGTTDTASAATPPTSPVQATPAPSPSAPTTTASPYAALPAVDVDRQVVGLDKVWAAGYTGKGVTIAEIGSGLYPHPDIKDAIKGFVDINAGKTAPYDAYGHDTQVAGIAVGRGVQSGGKIMGAAPGADLVGVRVTTVDEAIAGLEWVIANKAKYNIRIVSMPLGDTATQSVKDDRWAQECEKAIAAGLVVIVAAGDEGPDQPTDTPGDDPEVITVGALDDHKTLDRSKHEVASLSNPGPTTPDGFNKPDILAPGVKVWGPLVPNSRLDQAEIPHLGNDYLGLSGTSESVGFIAGAAADLLQADPTLNNQQVKDALMKTAAHYLPDKSNVQGAGVLDAYAALQMVLADKAKREQTAAA